MPMLGDTDLMGLESNFCLLSTLGGMNWGRMREYGEPQRVVAQSEH